MADVTKEARAAAEAPAKIADAVANTVDTVVRESDKAARRTRSSAARAARRQAAAKPATRAARKTASNKDGTSKVAAKASTRSTRKTRTAARTTAAHQRTETVTKNFFNGFDAVPAFAPFQTLYSEANERSQGMVKRSQKVAEELADLTRANVEAVVEASRVAAAGARSIGQNAVSSSRDSFEQAADAIRSLAEAKSPTEYLQLQSDFARASFDRAVAESSRFTESLVKLAGEAFQPLSNRASANAERFNTLVA